MIPVPNSRQVAWITQGVSRNMQTVVTPYAAPTGQGGGDLNGTAATTILLGHAGTAAQRIAVPRQRAGNYCGVI